MANWTFVEVNTPVTQRLSDLQGVAGDLQATEDIAKAFLQIPEDTSPTNLLHKECLCAAAIIRYGRSFATGVRQWDKEEVLSGLEDDLQIKHKCFIELRNKWIAHSVNAFEENTVQVFLTPVERGPKGIAWVSVSQNRVICLSMLDISRLAALAKAVRVKVEQSIETEKAAVIAALSTIPIDALYEKLDLPSDPPLSQHYSKRRNGR